jgi:hypothetical protein
LAVHGSISFWVQEVPEAATERSALTLQYGTIYKP